MLRDDFVDLVGFADSGLIFIPGLDFADSVSTTCKYYSSFRGKREITIQRTEGAGIFKIIRTDGPVKTIDEIINYYFKCFEEKIKTGFNDYRRSCYGNLYGRVGLPRFFLFLLYYTIFPSFY